VEAKACVRFARISARKAKIVIDLIKNKPVSEAIAILKFTPKAASPVLEKLLKSAVANAENNHNLNASDLYISVMYANQGPTMKRVMPKAQGRAARIRKRTSHITVVLSEKNSK
jgi:large subunit ribosomal protein L22